MLTCGTCGKEFSASQSLKRHLGRKNPCVSPEIVQPKQKTAVCAHCHKSFSRPDSLARHLKNLTCLKYKKMREKKEKNAARDIDALSSGHSLHYNSDEDLDHYFAQLNTSDDDHDSDDDLPAQEEDDDAYASDVSILNDDDTKSASKSNSVHVKKESADDEKSADDENPDGDENSDGDENLDGEKQDDEKSDGGKSVDSDEKTANDEKSDDEYEPDVDVIKKTTLSYLNSAPKNVSEIKVFKDIMSMLPAKRAVLDVVDRYLWEVSEGMVQSTKIGKTIAKKSTDYYSKNSEKIFQKIQKMIH